MTTKYTPLADMIAEVEAEEAEARLAAAKQAETEEAEARLAAAKQAETEEAEAEEATANALKAIKNAANRQKKAGGYPAVTLLMGSLSDLAVTGVLASGSSTPTTQAETNDLREQVKQLEAEVATQKDPNAHHSLAAQLGEQEEALAQATTELMHTQDELSKAKAAVSPQLTAATAETAKVRADLAKATQAQHDLQTQLDQANAARATAETGATRAKAEAIRLTQELADAEQISRNLTATNNALTRERDSLIAGHDTVKALVGSLPTIDLTNTVANPMFSGDVKVPLAQAKAINEFWEAVHAMYNPPATI